MLVVVDERAPQEALNKLKDISDDKLLFRSEGITYGSISCHPDIFMHQTPTDLIIAPNSPEGLFDFLNKHSIQYIIGEKLVGESLKASTPYNCVSTDKYLLHKSGYSDRTILEANSGKIFINLPQAYTRCSMVNLGDDTFITSDKGIEKVLLNEGLNCFFFDPSDIKIYGHKNGFLGGTCGIYNTRIYFIGNILLHSDGEGLLKFLEYYGYETVNLCNQKLYDGGGIFFL